MQSSNLPSTVQCFIPFFFFFFFYNNQSNHFSLIILPTSLLQPQPPLSLCLFPRIYRLPSHISHDMFDFGDEFSIEGGYRIPWLIWIQLLVLLLLLFLLYSFTRFASDRLDFTAGASTSASHLVSDETQIDKLIPKRNTTRIRTNRLETTQVWLG